ncbi:RimJ/RimL family protein N-acetyltransferase [Herbihabitans rhizosphaerae]|uniref:RimJ/RimL family protein N-acetyltransferase n=1 Tax=Herbihabitans rhizosphaerae TaxID=1872711 RepID=A0A4Q7KVH7_9PSEU|nr:GNAT family protein [Herbihabitans rhizosphaerae]RZS41038.1 RimJ/RimL family protein N-acetyltransferase [Herbihabitans rhizosphaerae]
MSYPLELRGAVVRLREFRESDLDASMAIVGDERVTVWMAFDTLIRDEQRKRLAAAIERAKAEPRTEYYLAVTTLDDDTLIGVIRLAIGIHRNAKIGYMIAADHWGHGYGTDAARTLITFGFRELGLHRITGAAGPDNAASIATLKRLGFTEEGLLREHVHTNGEWRDSVLYSVLEQEWK